jgi:hypothetical protein
MNRSNRWRLHCGEGAKLGLESLIGDSINSALIFGGGDRGDIGRGANVLNFSTLGACSEMAGTSTGLFGVIGRNDCGRAAVVFVG